MNWKIKSIVVTMALGLVFSGLMIIGTGEALCEPVAIAFQVDPGSQVTKLTYDVTYWKPANKECLQLKVTIKNILDKPERFKVTVKAEGAPYPASALVPRTGKPPQLSPQNEGSTTLPLYYDKLPKSVFVSVEKVE